MTNDSYGYDSGAGAGAGAIAAIGLMSVLYIALIVFGVYMYMRIARKAGWTLWHGLLLLVPVANIVFMIMFAFVEWPIERRLREAEQRLALAYGGPPPYGGYDPAAGYGTGAYGGAPYGGAVTYGTGEPALPSTGDRYAAPDAAQPWAPPSTDAAPPVPPAPPTPQPPSPEPPR